MLRSYIRPVLLMALAAVPHLCLGHPGHAEGATPTAHATEHLLLIGAPAAILILGAIAAIQLRQRSQRRRNRLRPTNKNVTQRQ